MRNIENHERRMTPAALRAREQGNLKNFMAAITPGGIEAQEKAGQMEQAEKQTLPFDLGQRFNGTVEEARKPWEALGFKFGKRDDLFTEAVFPAGWKKVPTDHDMWTDLVDDKGRKRGGIFYKAAFYDQRAHARLSTRFAVRETYEGPKAIRVEDACGIVKHEIAGKETNGLQGDDFNKAYDFNRAALKEVEAWLTANYPDWQNPVAYWS